MSRLIMVMGLPGSGKTYFARAIANEISALHFNSDIIRKKLSKHPVYSSAAKNSVYQALFDRVSQALKKGHTVVVDATFSKLQYRLPYFRFTKKNKIPLQPILVQADESTIAKRLEKKRPDSDADLKVYKTIKAEFEPLGINHLVLQSDKPVEEMVRQAVDHINRNSKSA